MHNCAQRLQQTMHGISADIFLCQRFLVNFQAICEASCPCCIDQHSTEPEIFLNWLNFICVCWEGVEGCNVTLLFCTNCRRFATTQPTTMILIHQEMKKLAGHQKLPALWTLLRFVVQLLNLCTMHGAFVGTQMLAKHAFSRCVFRGQGCCVTNYQAETAA